LLEWRLVQETGWTLEYIRAMSVKDLHAYIQVKDGMTKARA
jgi:hypothetical protein